MAGAHKQTKRTKKTSAHAKTNHAKTNHAKTERAKTERSWGALKRVVVGAGALVVVAGAAVVAALLFGRPKVSVSATGNALVQVHLSGLGTQLTSVQATSTGETVALVRGGDGLVPSAQISQGRQVQVTATAVAPSWLRWLLGSAVSSTSTVETTSAAPTSDVALASGPGTVPVTFDHPVSVIDYRSGQGPVQVVRLPQPSTVANLSVPQQGVAGSLQISAAPQPWEKVANRPSTVTWFVAPASSGPVALADPAPGSTSDATNGPITLTFAQPVAQVLGTDRPTISPSVAGSWSEPGPETLVFTPSDFGFGPGAGVTVNFGRPVSVVGVSTTGTATTTASTASATYHFTVAPGSVLRLQQILAQLGYLPVNFVPAAGVTMPTTMSQQVDTVSHPLDGTFTWRWPTTPAALQAMWAPGSANVMLKGALMQFASAAGPYDGYTLDSDTIDQLANASMWKELLQAALTNQMDPDAYSYVYVTESRPEMLSLWSNGSVVLTSLANTGIAEDPTPIGTFPIYLRYVMNFMSGQNPNGTPYHDLVHWINYFSGGSAVHGFVRGSYGYPQSLACVELPVSTAGVAFNHLAIGDLVTVT